MRAQTTPIAINHVLWRSHRRGHGRIRLNELSKSGAVAGYRDADIHGAAWVNDDRILFQLHDHDIDFRTRVVRFLDVNLKNPP